MFADKDDCDLHDSYQRSYVTSPAFSIGGPENPDIDGYGGRLIAIDTYIDGGVGLFITYGAIHFRYWPFDTNRCPNSPPPGSPGAGESFNWSRIDPDAVAGFPYGVQTTCLTDWMVDVSDIVPAHADSLIIVTGANSTCRHYSVCDLQDSGTPFFDNLQFGVYDTQGFSVSSFSRYADAFPLAEQTHSGMSPHSARADMLGNLGGASENTPRRAVRPDSVTIFVPVPAVSTHLRWRVEPGPCQELSNPFWTAYPAGIWHEARMDTARLQGPDGMVDPTRFATCFHPDEPHDGVSWGGEMTPVEPCDDILPDGVLTPGTRVDYFFEVRDATTGIVIGTGPSGWNYAPIDTTQEYADLWLDFEILPELLAAPAGGCDPSDPQDRANDMLVIAHGNSGLPGRWDHERLRATLDALGFDHDWLDTQGLYQGIGRREDRTLQVPRPPTHGATAAQLDAYGSLWWSSGLTWNWPSDVGVYAEEGGYPTQDQQTLEGWLHGCQVDGEERLLILDGARWCSFVDQMTNGPTFLAELGVDVLAEDYADFSNDLRRCSRITGSQAAAPLFDGQFFASGCPDSWPADVLVPIAGGEVVANYVGSGEGSASPIDCADDVNMPDWAAMIRHSAGTDDCRRSVAMGVAFAGLFDLNCTDECLFEDWQPSGGPSSSSQLLHDIFVWANKRSTLPPEPFSLLSPAHGDTGIAPVEPWFQWEPAGGMGTLYTMYLNGTGPTHAGADSVHGVSATSLHWPGGLDLLHDYFWSVRATNGHESIFDSEGWSRFTTSQVTPVELVRLTASSEAGRVVLHWEGHSEVGVLGYHVWRSTTRGSGYVQLTDELVRCGGPEGPHGTTAPYDYVDAEAILGESYYYHVEAIDRRGGSQLFGPVRVSCIDRPLARALHQNAPNPFNPSTSIGFELKQVARVRLVIFDVAGRRVRTLAQGPRDPGLYDVLWDGRSDSGEAVGSGVYFYRLEIGKWRRTRKMLCLR